MPEDREGFEQLLVGADRPRPLPPALRARLEEVLAGGAGTGGAPGPSGGAGLGGGARPLSGEVRERLESTLRPARAGGKWKLVAATVAAAAAAVAVLAGVVAPGLLHGPG
ncbi:MAG: hypothetical protein ACRDZX_10605, partial [Acidimicrobiales bacterium]